MSTPPSKPSRGEAQAPAAAARDAHAPLLVLLPGLDGSGELFAPLLRELGGTLATSIVRYPDDPQLDYPALASVARSTLPEGRRIILVAESFSGPIGVMLAASLPNVAGLVLCASFVSSPRPALRFLTPLLKLLPRFLLVALGPLLLLGRSADPALRRLLRQVLRGLSTATVRARLKLVAEVDRSAEFAGLRLPILCLRARHDRLVPRSATTLVLQLQPDARRQTLAAGHSVLQTAPADAARALWDFAHWVGPVGPAGPAGSVGSARGGAGR